METITTFINENPEYIIKRKRAVLFFMISVYEFCALFLILHFSIVGYETNRILIMCAGFFIFIGCCLSLGYMDKSKKFYNNVLVPQYNDIKVLTMKNIIIYSIPVLVTAYFALLQVICLILVIGTIIHKFNVAQKPYYQVNKKQKFWY